MTDDTGDHVNTKLKVAIIADIYLNQAGNQSASEIDLHLVCVCISQVGVYDVYYYLVQHHRKTFFQEQICLLC